MKRSEAMELLAQYCEGLGSGYMIIPDGMKMSIFYPRKRTAYQHHGCVHAYVDQETHKRQMRHRVYHDGSIPVFYKEEGEKWD